MSNQVKTYFKRLNILSKIELVSITQLCLCSLHFYTVWCCLAKHFKQLLIPSDVIESGSPLQKFRIVSPICRGNSYTEPVGLSTFLPGRRRHCVTFRRFWEWFGALKLRLCQGQRLQPKQHSCSKQPRQHMLGTEPNVVGDEPTGRRGSQPCIYNRGS